MTPDARLSPQDWMTRSETQAVVEALTAEGTEVRFVGGCVRDALAGRRVRDIDLATPDPPEKVIELLEKAGLKAVPTGIAHGTVTAVANHQPFEVTTLRRDVATDGRRATVAFTDDWEADAARRDFTFNALSCRRDGSVFDPFGGLADLKAGRVRFVGEAVERIREDYLRLLRFFRFHAFYGRGDPDPEGLEAASSTADHLPRLSGERIRAELLRLLEAEDPIPVLKVMHARRILASVLPQVGAADALENLIALDVEDPKPDRLLRLGALLTGNAEAVATTLRLSRAERDRLLAMCSSDVAPPAIPDPANLRHAIYRQGGAVLRDLIALARARSPDTIDAEAAGAALDTARNWQPPTFPLSGRDALDLGLEPGEKLGRLLKETEDWWLKQDFTPDREQCLAHLKRLAQGQRYGT